MTDYDPRPTYEPTYENIEDMYAIQHLYSLQGKLHYLAKCKECGSHIADWWVDDQVPSMIGRRCHTCGHDTRIRIPDRILEFK